MNIYDVLIIHSLSYVLVMLSNYYEIALQINKNYDIKLQLTIKQYQVRYHMR